MAARDGENRLALETSPYLLQHAGNPVDWYPWGDEALERAKREDKPILLSIGYSACHWCHVMAHECFESEAIAALVNSHFVCIKVDREERPDLDDVYMGATVALSGSGGWPMTVFLTPERQPFFAGTYFPPETRGSRIGFRPLVERIAELWATQRSELLAQALQLTGYLRARAAADAPPSDEGVRVDALICSAIAELRASFDPTFGGFGEAPKFPPSAALSLLLRAHRRSGDETLLAMVTRTLDAMAKGGIYDHLAGGFARYSTDERWLVPHFEKMLYDNAQLTSVYLRCYQVTGEQRFAQVARETLDYVVREMQGEGGGYFSSTDADSEGEEGRYFVFTPKEVRERLEPKLAKLFCAYFDVTPVGNWEGASILNTPRPLEEVARGLGLGLDQAEDMLATARRRIFEARQARVPPLLDDKVLTSWNGLMIGAMSEGARVLGEPRYYESAARAARFAIGTLMREDGRLYRTARGNQAKLAGYLEDYAFLADGLVSLYEASGRFPDPLDPSDFLIAAKTLAERIIDDFGSETGAFYSTAHQHEPLLVRQREGQDGALPSPNAVAARALARLAHLLDRKEWLPPARRAVEAHGWTMTRAPRAFATSLEVLELCRSPALEVVSVGVSGSAELEQLLAEASNVYLPDALWVVTPPDSERNDRTLSILRGKTLVRNAPALYLCRNFSCNAPITDPGEVAAALQTASAETRVALVCDSRAE
jgi:uncharacterized protein YyaL (SSP411 family)